MSESRQRQRIRRAAESRGYAVESLNWEPVYLGGEMEGPCGGWELVLDRPFLSNTFPGDDLGALSVEELLAQIDYWLQPTEPCACDRTHSADMAARLINDPQKPTHGPECKWHIPYRLRWWSTENAEQLRLCKYCEISEGRCGAVRELGYVKCCPDCDHRAANPITATPEGN